MFLTSIKDNCSKASPLTIWSSCFSHMGEDDEAEMDDRKMTFRCPLLAWASAHPLKKKKDSVSEYCLLRLGRAHFVRRSSKEGRGGVRVWSNVFKDVPVKHKLPPILVPPADRRKEGVLFTLTYAEMSGCQTMCGQTRRNITQQRADISTHGSGCWVELLIPSAISQALSRTQKEEGRARSGLISNSKLFCHKDLSCTVSSWERERLSREQRRRRRRSCALTIDDWVTQTWPRASMFFFVFFFLLTQFSS